MSIPPESAETLPNAAECGVDVRIISPEPTSERAADEVRHRGRRRPLHHEVLAVEEVRRIDGIRRHWRETVEAAERRLRPLPAVADEVVYAPRARARRVRADRDRVPVREAEVAARRVRRLVAPRIPPLLARRRAERGAVVLGLGHQALAAPFGERDRFFLRR